MVAAVVFYGTHFHDGPHVDLTAASAVAMLAALALGALAWAAPATAVTTTIPTVDAANPIRMLTYFPVIITSGVLGTLSQPLGCPFAGEEPAWERRGARSGCFWVRARP